MNALQPELALYRKREVRKKLGPQCARRMIAVLYVHGGWVTRREFQEKHGIPWRECALGREASHGRILMGQHGFRLLTKATPEEIHEALATWVSQIRAAQKQYATLCRRAHRMLAAGTKEAMKTEPERKSE